MQLVTPSVVASAVKMLGPVKIRALLLFDDAADDEPDV